MKTLRLFVLLALVATELASCGPPETVTVEVEVPVEVPVEVEVPVVQTVEVQVPVEVVDRLPFRLGSKLARAFPVLEQRLLLVALDGVLVEGGVDDLAVPEIGREPARVAIELLGGGEGHDCTSTSAR